MTETHDGRIQIPADRRRYQHGVESLFDLAGWLAIHPRIGHPELSSVAVPPAVALDVLDETWTIEPTQVSPAFCTFTRWFGPYRLQLFTESQYFGRIIDDTTTGEPRFVPTPVRTLLRDRVEIMTGLELEDLL